MSRRALQPLQRFEDLRAAAFGLLALFLLAVDDLLGRLAHESGLPSLASTRLMSASALAISFCSRACSAATSMMPLSGSAATSPRTTSCTEPVRRRVREDDLRHAREPLEEIGPARRRAPCVSSEALTSASGVGAEMFISARTERIALTRSTTQPISASASALSSPSCAGHVAEREQRGARRGRRHAPQFLGDERHERMQQLQHLVAHPGDHRARLGLGRAVRPGQHRLRQLEIPVAIDVPHEAIGRARRLVELVAPRSPR